MLLSQLPTARVLLRDRDGISHMSARMLPQCLCSPGRYLRQARRYLRDETRLSHSVPAVSCHVARSLAQYCTARSSTRRKLRMIRGMVRSPATTASASRLWQSNSRDHAGSTSRCSWWSDMLSLESASAHAHAGGCLRMTGCDHQRGRSDPVHPAHARFVNMNLGTTSRDLPDGPQCERLPPSMA